MKIMNIKIIILITAFLNIFITKNVCADENGILIKSTNLKELSIFVTIKYGEGSIATVYLNENNNFSEKTSIVSQEVNIEEFIITSNEGEVTDNYKLYGTLTDNVFDIVVEKVDNQKPIKNENTDNYDGSTSNYKSDNKDIGDVEIAASVPEDFYSDIKIFFVDNNGNNMSYILRYPEYTTMATQRVGALMLKEIKIIDDIGQYSIQAEEKLEVKKDEKLNYKIDVKLKELDSVGEKVPTDEEREFEKIKNQIIKEDNTSNNIEDKQSGFGKIIVTIIITFVLGAIYLFMKIRKGCD